jgi:hypothetical protein
VENPDLFALDPIIDLVWISWHDQLADAVNVGRSSQPRI